MAPHRGIDRNDFGALTRLGSHLLAAASSSAVDSTLKPLDTTCRARRIRQRFGPGRERRSARDSPPAAAPVQFGHQRTMSKPAPRRASRFNTAQMELALTAKHNQILRCAAQGVVPFCQACFDSARE